MLEVARPQYLITGPQPSSFAKPRVKVQDRLGVSGTRPDQEQETFYVGRLYTGDRIFTPDQ